MTSRAQRPGAIPVAPRVRAADLHGDSSRLERRLLVSGGVCALTLMVFWPLSKIPALAAEGDTMPGGDTTQARRAL